MMRCLFYGESPCIDTGLAKVSRVVLDGMQQAGYTVKVIATNHHMVVSYDKTRFPYDILPIVEEDNGEAHLTLAKAIEEEDFDLFFLSTDFGRDHEVYKALVKKKQQGHSFATMGYYAVDCDIVSPFTFDGFNYCDVRVTYTKHGRDVVTGYQPAMKDSINVVYLPTEPDKFYPLTSEERKQARHDLFGVDDDDEFICLSVNRNQGRKDLCRLMAIFHEYHMKINPKSRLYMHCKETDLGGSLYIASISMGMRSTKEHPEILFTGKDYSALVGFSVDTLNKVYNACDALLSCSTGEGWGLSTTEAMCAGLPVIVPGNTANLEIVGEERGYLVKAGGDIDHRTFLYGMTPNPRDIVHSEDMLRLMEHVRTHPQEAHEKALVARTWTRNYTTPIQTEKWKTFFEQLEVRINDSKQVATIA